MKHNLCLVTNFKAVLSSKRLGVVVDANCKETQHFMVKVSLWIKCLFFIPDNLLLIFQISGQQIEFIQLVTFLVGIAQQQHDLSTFQICEFKH